jgi:hypothetical protein
MGKYVKIDSDFSVTTTAAQLTSCDGLPFSVIIIITSLDLKRLIGSYLPKLTNSIASMVVD